MGVMSRMTLADLSPRLRAIAMAQMQGKGGDQDAPRLAIPAQRVSRQPTKTEEAYGAILAHRFADVRYEALTFRLACGHRYTPDWVCVDPDGRITCVEVKGNYRMGSYQRARLAFDQARLEWPAITWEWVEKTSTGWRTR